MSVFLPAGDLSQTQLAFTRGNDGYRRKLTGGDEQRTCELQPHEPHEFRLTPQDLVW
jgi:hypothetical protein